MIWLTIMFILLLLWQNWRVAGVEEKHDELERRIKKLEERLGKKIWDGEPE